jgi:hypothetical protein
MRPVSEEQVARVAAVTNSDPETASVLLGQVQSVFDALKAIREGGSFRGLTDPRAIAAEATRNLVDADGEPV